MQRVLTIIVFVSLVYCTNCFSQVRETPAPEYISTIQFKGATAQSELPILRLGERLDLSFDDINGNEEDYYYIIEHFNFDWTPSDLSKSEYLNGFDDVRITDYINSFNTLQMYSHYRVSIPNSETRGLTKSGNYLISVYDDNRELVFSRKFMIVENIAGVTVEIKRARQIKDINSKQVVQFIIDSPNLLLVNPKQTVKTLVLQNSNLNSAITDLKPQYTLGNKLVYNWDTEAAFGGGNEFFNFDNTDIRSGNSTIRRTEILDIYHNYLYTGYARKNRPYTYNPDINGNFVVRNIDVQNVAIEGEYVWMHFNLQYFEDIGDKELHIYGNFNNWTIDESTYLKYDPASDSYRNTRLFKQGFYNYRYVLVDRDGSVDEGAIGGDFWETENQYTVLVYFRNLGARFDRLIGMGTANSTNITNN